MARLTVRDPSEAPDWITGLREVLYELLAVLDLSAKLQNALLSLLVGRREENTVSQMTVQDAPSHRSGDNGRFSSPARHGNGQFASVQHDVLQSFDQFFVVRTESEAECTRVVFQQVEFQVRLRLRASVRIHNGRNLADFAASG